MMLAEVQHNTLRIFGDLQQKEDWANYHNKKGTFVELRRNPVLTKPAAPAPAPTRNDPNAMDLSKAKTGKQVKVADRKYRIENNLCLYCGGEGHRVSNCPNKKPAETGTHSAQSEEVATEEDDSSPAKQPPGTPAAYWRFVEIGRASCRERV